MTRRPRTLSVLAILLGGAIAIISSTQIWLTVTLRAGTSELLTVAGAAAAALLAPLSLAALALGLALAVVGRVLAYAFGALATVIGVTLVFGSLRVVLTHPMDAYAAAVTQSTGLSGTEAIAELVAHVDGTAWPWLAALAGVLIALGGLLTLASVHRWQAGGRRYERDAPRTEGAVGSRPHDAIDSWDDLTHGEDPTAFGQSSH